MPTRKPLTRSRAWTCVLINQLATPGLGSIIAGRRISGLCQLGLALIGFILLVGWMVNFFYALAMNQLEQPPPTGSYGWMGKWGLLSFGAGWVWSLVTSALLLREAGEEPPPRPPDLPPPVERV